MAGPGGAASAVSPFGLMAQGVVNHLLRAESWARDRLRPHAGRTVLVRSFPFPIAFTILDSGEVAAARRDASADLEVTLTPGAMLRIAARDDAVFASIPVEGDADLAASIEYVARNLRWDYEEDLSRLVGDAAAHRMGMTLRDASAWAARSADGVARSFAEYWTEEQPLFARRADIDRFCRDVDVLRDDVARIEKAIDRLDHRG